MVNETIQGPGLLRGDNPSPARAGEPAVQARLELPCEQIGFEPPPATTHIRFMRTADGWRLMLFTRGENQDAAMRWLSGHGTFQLVEGANIHPRLRMLRIREMPAAWSDLLARFQVTQLVLEPDGTASLGLVGARGDLRAFTKELGAQGEAPKLTGITTVEEEDQPEGLLTDRQHKALAMAVSEGYYDVPRRINLRELAREMDMSPGSLSELLRRAEERLAKAYLSSTLGTSTGLSETTPMQDRPWPMPPVEVAGDQMAEEAEA